MSLPKPRPEALLAADDSLIIAIASQIEKDFGVFNLRLATASPDGSPYERLRQVVIPQVRHLLEHDYGALLSLLYRIDVSERKIAAASALEPKKALPEIFTELIIEREWQKVCYRQQYGGG